MILSVKLNAPDNENESGPTGPDFVQKNRYAKYNNLTELLEDDNSFASMLVGVDNLLTDLIGQVENRVIWDLYERQYPGCKQEILEVFGHLPTTAQVAEWKATWTDTGTIVELDRPVVIREVCAKANIHPFFYQQLTSGKYGPRKSTKRICFYKDPHAIMFKIAVSTYGT